MQMKRAPRMVYPLSWRIERRLLGVYAARLLLLPHLPRRMERMTARSGARMRGVFAQMLKQGRHAEACPRLLHRHPRDRAARPIVPRWPPAHGALARGRARGRALTAGVDRFGAQAAVRRGAQAGDRPSDRRPKEAARRG